MASGSSSGIIRNCPRCGHELGPGAVACGQCHSLIYAGELQHLSEQANLLEAKGELRQARDAWLKGLPLLPRSSRQAAWITEHVAELNRAADRAQLPETATAQPENPWATQAPRRSPLTLSFLLSLLAFIGFYWFQFGVGFGVGFAVLVFVHEMGHFIDIKRRGLPADMPVFLPGLGAYVRWRALGVSLETRAAVSLAGPLAGLIGAAVCALLWWKTGDPLWARLARASAWLNALNLIPVWVLDGSQAVLALGKSERVAILISSLALFAVLRERVFILVALGVAWRLFTKDTPPRPSWATLAYFVIVMAGLGGVMWFAPGQGFGI